MQKNFIVNNNNRTIRAWYLREVPEEICVSAEKDWNFLGKDY